MPLGKQRIAPIAHQVDLGVGAALSEVIPIDRRHRAGLDSIEDRARLLLDWGERAAQHRLAPGILGFLERDLGDFLRRVRVVVAATAFDRKELKQFQIGVGAEGDGGEGDIVVA